MTLRLNGSTSGYTEIDAPAMAGSNTLVLPGGNGTNGQVLSTNGSGALSWIDRTQTTLATSVASTSGTAIDFTGIPSWAKRVTLMFNGVSTNGTSILQVQLGAGSVTTTGYQSDVGAIVNAASVSGNNHTNGFLVLHTGIATASVMGTMELTNITGNTWVCSSMVRYLVNYVVFGAGAVSLSGALDRVRLTSINGTDAFDAGTLNIMYQG